MAKENEKRGEIFEELAIEIEECSGNVFSFANEHPGVSVTLRKSLIESIKEGISKTFKKEGPTKVSQYQLVTHESRYKTEETWRESVSNSSSFEEVAERPNRDIVHFILKAEKNKEESGKLIESETTPDLLPVSHCSESRFSPLSDLRYPTGPIGPSTTGTKRQLGSNELGKTPFSLKNFFRDKTPRENEVSMFRLNKEEDGESFKCLGTPRVDWEEEKLSQVRSSRERHQTSKSTFQITREILESMKDVNVPKKQQSKWETARKVFRAVELDNK